MSQEKALRAMNNGYEFSPTTSISAGFSLFQRAVWPFIGYTILMFIISAAVGAIPIPLLSNIMQAILIAGFYLYGYKLLNRQNPEFSDFFKGFSMGGPLAAVALLTLLISSAVLIIGAVILLGGSWQVLTNPTPDALMNFQPNTLGLALMGLGIIPAIYFGVSYLFAPQLVIFSKMKPWEAMETSRKIVGKKFWSFFGFALLLGLVNIVGALLLGIGLLVTIPASILAIHCAFVQTLDLNSDLDDSEDLSRNLIDKN